MATARFNEFHNEADRQRLLDIAQALTTPQEIVASIIKDALGEEIDSMTRIVRGESNEVYGVITKNKSEMILRIGHWDKKTFEREAWAVEQVASVGVPVPKILAVGDIATEAGQTYYSIQGKLQGTTLDTLLYSSGLSPERAKPIVENAGEALGRIHSIQTSGWGYLVEPTRGELAELSDKYHRVEAESDRLAAALRKTNVPLPDIKIILDQLKAGLSRCESNQRLVHGDFGPKHIFVDANDTITGIIDWEQAESTDPTVEFARWNFWFEKVSPTAWLRAGHERATPLGDNYDERFRIAKLQCAIWTLMYFTYNSAVEDCAARAAIAIKEAII